ncbi:MAG: PHP domain-containing protein [Gammaproteobacteria bacterium]
MSATARLDLHCHTLHSGDCFVPLEQVVEIAVSRGVTHLAVTDHDSCECRRRHADRSWPLQLIFGEEVTLGDGTHLIALDIREEIKGRTLAAALAEIREAGGFSLVPHPFKKGSGIFAGEDERELAEAKKLVAEWADAIEVCNAKLPDRDNERAFGLARELGKSITAGADAHFGYDVGDAVLEVEAGSRTADWRELVGGGRGARVLINRFVRRKLFDEHVADTGVSNLWPRIRRLVPRPLRTVIKRNLHRIVYQPRVRRRDFALEELQF